MATSKKGKTINHFLQTLSTILYLVILFRNAIIIYEKAEVLNVHLSPAMPDADPPIIPNPSYPPSLPSSLSTSEEEFSSIIKKLPPFKASGSDDYLFFALKCLQSPLVSFLTPLVQVCSNFFYCLTAFCHCNIVSLWTLGKGDDLVPCVWRPTDLLNTLRKVLERVIAQYFSSLSEEHNLLLDQYIGTSHGRSTYTTRDFMVQQIHGAWQNKDSVATLLT
jgi:hypothetical protein